MRFTLLALATASTLASAQTPSPSPIGAVIPVGGDCVPGGTPCALGAQCYATNSMLQPRCGNFQASCTSDQQCAVNTCNGGFCNGVLPSSAPAPPQSSAIGAVIPVGGDCTPNGTPCALGSQCYATNSMLQPRCGNFQASCTSNQQCAFNTCNGGFCNGLLPSSVSMSVTPTSTGGYMGAPSSTVTAPAGSLPLGAQCNPNANPSQCATGVQCFASNVGLIPACGNFNAACSSNAQCAFNTCQNGLCSGLLPSGSGNTTMSMQPSRTPTMSASATKSSAAEFTGAAAVANIAGGAMAVVLGAFAWVL